MEVMRPLIEKEEEVVEEPLVTERRREKHLDTNVTHDVSNNSYENSDGDSKGVGFKEVNGNNSEQKTAKINEMMEKSVYLDKNEGTSTLQWTVPGKNVDIPGIVNAVINRQHIIENGIHVETMQEEAGKTHIGNQEIRESRVRIDLVDENEEEVIELEFESAVEKIHTHTAYCPNCSSQITKVILRRRKREDRRPPEKRDVFGCLSCFSIFIPSGNVLSPFRIFGGKHQTTQKVDEYTSTPNISPGASGADTAGADAIPKQGGRAFDLFWIFRKKGDSENLNQTPETLPGRDVIIDIEHGKGATPSRKPGTEIHEDTGAATDITPGTGTGNDVNVRKPALASEQRGTKSVEILKCIVYGGLLETITSLSIVSSAAASDASTLSIIAIAVANLVSGLLVIGNNLIIMRNEASEGSTDNDTSGRYQELLGRKEHFLLHATLAILSFLVFGLVPPLVYGFAFLEIDNKDYTILAVAAASFACILILSIAKAYTKRLQKFSEYLKTILYYLMLGITASGVGYAVGDLVSMLLHRLGWFEQNPAAPTFTTNMNLASFPWASS